MHVALEEHVKMACLPQWRREDEDRRGKGRGGWGAETRRTKVNITWLHRTENSLKKVDFNSPAVGTNKNPLKNRRVCWKSVGWVLPPCSYLWAVCCQMEWKQVPWSSRHRLSSPLWKSRRKIKEEKFIGIKNQTICYPSSCTEKRRLASMASVSPSLWIKLSGFIVLSLRSGLI